MDKLLARYEEWNDFLTAVRGVYGINGLAVACLPNRADLPTAVHSGTVSRAQLSPGHLDLGSAVGLSRTFAS